MTLAATLRAGSIAMFFSVLSSCSNGLKGRWIASGGTPEDLVIVDRAGKRTVITGTSRISLFGPHPAGALEAFTPGKNSNFEDVFRGSKECGFHPTGLCAVQVSRYPRWKGKSLIYVNNQKRRSVDVFEVRKNGDILRCEWQLPEFPRQLKRANGIAAFPDGSVYVTHFGFWPSRNNEKPVTYPGKKSQNTIYAYIPAKAGETEGGWKPMASGFNGCNGLAPGPDGKSLLVASLHSKSIWTLQRDPVTGDLSAPNKLRLSLSFHPDNIKNTREGHYELCGQLSAPGTALNLAFGWPVSPGGALAFDWDGNTLGNQEDRTAMLKGHNSSPSTAIRLGDTLYIGQARHSRVLAAPYP